MSYFRDLFTSVLKGLVPASGGGTTNFLRADGIWSAPPGGGGSSAYGSERQYAEREAVWVSDGLDSGLWQDVPGVSVTLSGGAPTGRYVVKWNTNFESTSFSAGDFRILIDGTERYEIFIPLDYDGKPNSLSGEREIPVDLNAGDIAKPQVKDFGGDTVDVTNTNIELIELT